LGRAALRREQREQFERNHRKNRATGKKVRLITDVTSTALGKKEMVTPIGYSRRAVLRREKCDM
jgi:hypothetical protein